MELSREEILRSAETEIDSTTIVDEAPKPKKPKKPSAQKAKIHAAKSRVKEMFTYTLDDGPEDELSKLKKQVASLQKQLKDKQSGEDSTYHTCTGKLLSIQLPSVMCMLIINTIIICP